MATILLKWNQPNVHQLGTSITLKPGVNEVDSEAFNQAKKIQLVQFYLKEKQLEQVSSADAGGDEGDEGSDLSQYSATDAIALVKETTDVGLLNKWKAAESRKTVNDAIDSQLEDIDPNS